MTTAITRGSLLCIWGFVSFAPACRGEEFQWQTASPESQGVSSDELNSLRNSIADSTRALLVIRNDRIIFEWYAEGNSERKKQGTASLAKAIVGGLSLAVAMEDGLIAFDDPAWKYVPDWKSDPLKSKITIRHLGSHTSGIDDSHNRPERERGVDQGNYTGWTGDFWRWRQGKQRPPNDAFTISRDLAPALFEPGTDYQYSNPGMAMLTWCVTASLKGTNTPDLRSLLRDRIMQPIGVSDEDWSCSYRLTEVVDGLPMVANWGGGSYTPRAVARIGRLTLRRGDWDGQQLLSAKTVENTVNDAGLPAHFGMGWWTNADGHFPDLPKDAVWGAGAGHQILLVVPSLKLIAVRNGNTLRTGDAEGAERSVRDPLYVRLFQPLMAAVMDTPESTTSASQRPYPRSQAIRRVEFDFSTHRRLAVGSDNWPITWAADGNQYAAWGDGGGFGGSNRDGRVTLGVARIEGEPERYTGRNIWGGKNPKQPAEFDGKSYGILSVDGVLYMWVCCQPAKHLRYCQIASSEDMGEHWKLADWRFRFEDDVSIPTFLNFGQDYRGARDEYVYSYLIHPTWGPGSSPRGNYGFDVHRPGRVYLARVPKAHILDRGRFEFFAGQNEQGKPQWTSDIEEKLPVFEDANGVGWNLSASFSPVLNRYILCTEHGATHVGKLGLFDAPEPWGPWSTVAYEEAWGEGEIEVSTFFWSVPNRWLEEDGRFTMVFTGKNTNDSWNTVQGRFVLVQNEVTPRGDPPISPSPVIARIDWAPPDQILRAAKGGDNWPITWADDDLLYTAYGDGRGFEPFVPEKLSMGFAKVFDGPENFRGINIRSESGETVGDGRRGKKASGLLMIDGVLYVLVRNAGNSQLGWSEDHGVSWQWADWRFETSFGCPTFLNFGRNYAGARDEFVYIYSLDSDSAYDPADRMVLARVPKDQLRNRNAYEFFLQLDDSPQPLWTADIDKRGAVFEHPGRCYRSGITYNSGLRRYLWCQVFPESKHANGPRFQGGFGIFDAPQPWGPWTTAYFTNEWDVGPGETSSLPTKWMSADGQIVYLVFSGEDHFSVRRGKLITRP